MVRQSLAVVLAAALVAGAVGCGGGGRRPASRSLAEGNADAPAEAMSDTQLAAHAGDAEFPRGSGEDNLRVAAVVTRDRRVVKLYNFEPRGIRAVNVWINGAYVQPLRGIPANSKAVVRTEKVFNKFGHRFSERGEEVNRVQLETQDGLYNVMGPATE